MLPSYTITLSKEGMDIILSGLGELPHKVARGVYDSTLRQLQEQEQQSVRQQAAANGETASQS